MLPRGIRFMMVLSCTDGLADRETSSHNL